MKCNEARALKLLQDAQFIFKDNSVLAETKEKEKQTLDKQKERLNKSCLSASISNTAKNLKDFVNSKPSTSRSKKEIICYI